MEKLHHLKQVKDIVGQCIVPTLRQNNPAHATSHAAAVVHHLATVGIPQSTQDIHDLNRKCRLGLTAEALEEMVNAVSKFNGRPEGVSLPSPSADRVPTVSLNSLQRCRTTVQDFVKSYFMFHNLQQEDFFRYMDILLYVEATIYQLDEANESVLLAPHSQANVRGGMESTLKVLCSVLQHRGLWDERIAKELKEGEEYWRLERQLCQTPPQCECTMEMIDRAIRLKSFDFRVMNLVLYRLRGAEYDEASIDFMSTSELLVEISDDIYDYEDDVIKSSFNVYRFFIRMYGTDAPARMMAYITDVEKDHELKIGLLAPDLQSRYKQRCAEAMDEGGPGTGRTWLLPPVILDEEQFRSALPCQTFQ